MKRRRFLLLPVVVLPGLATAEVTYEEVQPGKPFEFPRDHGAHPAFRTEWWYVTGWLRDAAQQEFGMQITFFRNRPGLQEGSASRFAPQQLLFAHAALADPTHGRLRHDQRAARAGLGLAEASRETTDVHIDDWRLRLEGDRYEAHIRAAEFELDLAFSATQPVLLQGAGGVSRKGPRPLEASFYYSRPHLAVEGTVTRAGQPLAVTGRAWLDHEWSSRYLAPEAAGWDWVGLLLDDGAALMAFCIRHRDGGVLWAGGTLRDASGVSRTLTPDDVRFAPTRHWRSPRSGTDWPVAMRLRAAGLELTLDPLMDDQELDSRASVGTIYWEGAVRVSSAGRPIGRGYLELTGYWKPMKL